MEKLSKNRTPEEEAKAPAKTDSDIMLKCEE